MQGKSLPQNSRTSRVQICSLNVGPPPFVIAERIFGLASFEKNTDTSTRHIGEAATVLVELLIHLKGGKLHVAENRL